MNEHAKPEPLPERIPFETNMNLTMRTPKLPPTYKYAPLPDITALEVAYLLEFCIAAVSNSPLEKLYEKMPPEARRHLEVVEG